VVTTAGEHPISVWSKKLAPGTHLQSDADDVAAAKFACVKATAVVRAPPQAVYQLFLDNSRVCVGVLVSVRVPSPGYCSVHLVGPLNAAFKRLLGSASLTRGVRRRRSHLCVRSIL
jgi:hypothetical protein